MAERERELSALLSSATLVMLGGIMSSAANLAERVVIGRLLSPAAYGEVSIGIALLMFILMIALAGCTQGVSRFIPRYEAVEDRRGVWVSGLLVTTTLSLILGVTMFLVAEPIAARLFETDEAVIFVRFLAVSLPFIVSFRIAVAGIRGYENTIYKTAIQSFLDPFLRTGLIALLLLSGIGIIAVGIAYFLAAILTSLVAHVLLNQIMNLRGRYRTHTGELLTFSMPLVVSTVIGIMLSRTDTLMLGYFRSSYEVGMYDAAYPIAAGLTVVLSAFGFLYLPIASRLDADGERDVVNDIYSTSTKWVYILTFPAFLLLVVFPQDVIMLIFGPSYTNASAVLPILAVGFFLSATAGRDRETLSAVGATTWIAVGNGTGIIANILLNIVLIPRYGYMGAGVASVISLFIVHTVICGILAAKYNITPLSPEAVRCYVFLPIVLLPLAFVLSPWISISIVTLFPFLVTAGIISLIVVGLVGGLEPDDAVVINLIEDKTGVSLPLVRRWIPNSDKEATDSFYAN
ncbi:oligosaccharide flippase family protein [Halosolutus halophilus]|uniref:oligosaccharide flippase family protein n=1 Tax=Halosolutus halophilus TaxID=1552990 RepID=UPI0022350D7D|nr:oligosaccharide flippase family protein [Halosolutus halophilus]